MKRPPDLIRRPRRCRCLLSLSLVVLALVLPLREGFGDEVVEALRQLDLSVLPADERPNLTRMVARDIERRRLAAIRRENRAWDLVKTREDWERFRDKRIEALRRSLGLATEARGSPPVRVASRFEADGFRVENLVFESRPGLFVTANLYVPLHGAETMPAVLFSHSHHAPKTQGELLDMGGSWARQGWLVLVMDHVGHGERRQHPFTSRDSYPGEFRLSRQDYYFRYNVALELALVGESLMGWIVRDLMRGLDLLFSREDVDTGRVILIGSVAGGGDPAGVTAALDPRVSAVAPFNFGGPQPDYAIPADAQNEFYYFGVAYWESTRCLRLGARDGFAHWVIVGSVAPRGLIYAHEFAWDRPRDPVWPRLEKVFDVYGARDRLASLEGRGTLKGRPPESTHCTNVGPYHRRQLYPHLEHWFGMAAPADHDQKRLDPGRLLCLTPEVERELTPRAVHELANDLAGERLLAARRRREALDGPAARRHSLRDEWAALLGDVQPYRDPEVLESRKETTKAIAVERISLSVEDGIIVPLVLVRAASGRYVKPPFIVVLARPGKQALVERRATALAEMLRGGGIVCLPDLRGTGETSPGSAVGFQSTGTTLSCRDQVLGQTLLGSRLRDLRSVLRYLRGREDAGGPIALWGESLAQPNPDDRSEVVPLGVSHPNTQAEPTPGLLALLGALFEDDVRGVVARGTFASYRSLLESRFLYIPHDAVVPGALTAGDVDDIAAALAPRAVRIEAPVNGLNRIVSGDDLEAALSRSRSAYRLADANEKLSLHHLTRDPSTVRWLLAELAE